MRSIPATLALLSLPLAALGDPLAALGDPLKSPECARSIAALEAARAAPGSSAGVEALRRQATLACLGGSGEPTRPSPTARPPVAVAPPVADVLAPPPAAAAPAPPPLEIERAPVITACDAAGCWTSEGTRLNRAGPILVGPGGACVTSGHVVRCP